MNTNMTTAYNYLCNHPDFKAPENLAAREAFLLAMRNKSYGEPCTVLAWEFFLTGWREGRE